MRNDIAFDIDDVMIDFTGPVHEIIKSRGYTYEESGYYDILKSVTPEMPKKELYKIFDIVYKDPYCFPIFEKAPELCTRLYLRTGEPIRFVTGRRTETAAHTHTLVKRFCKVPYTIAFATDSYNKIIYLKDINYFAEDRRRIAMDLASNGKTVFMPKKDWNKIDDDFKAIDNIVYIENVNELLKHIKLFFKKYPNDK